MTEFSALTEKIDIDGTELLLGASSATQELAEKYSPAKLFSNARNQLQGAVSLRDYIDGEPSGDVDYSSELQQAHDDAAAANLWVYLPPGAYGIGSTVTLKAPMSGERIGRSYDNRENKIPTTRLVPLMNDGTAVLQGILVRNLYIGNFSIYYNAGGTGSTRNCIGLDMGYGKGNPSPTDTACNVNVIDNMLFNGLAIGFQITGWLNTMRDLYMNICNLGFQGYWTSDCVWDGMRVEKSNQGWIMHTGNSNVFSILSDEGTAGATASTMTSLTATSIGSYRTEEPNRVAQPWLKVDACSGFYMQSGYIYTPGASAYAVELTNVKGYSINATFRSNAGQSRHTVLRDSDTRGDCSSLQIVSEIHATTSRAAFQQLPRVNRFPNPYIQGIRFPFEIELNNCTITEENTLDLTWHGDKAMRITVDSGTSGSYIKFKMDTAAILSFANDRRLGVYCWVWVPDLPAFVVGGDARPAIALSGYKGAAEVDYVASLDDQHVHGSWNLMWAYKRQDTNLDELWFYVYLNNSASVLSGGEYVILGNAAILEASSSYEFQMGKWADSALSGAQCIGENVDFHVSQAKATAIKSYTTHVWKAGDRLAYSDPSTYIGEVCTTAGTGGAAVWKTYGAIGA